MWDKTLGYIAVHGLLSDLCTVGVADFLLRRRGYIPMIYTRLLHLHSCGYCRFQTVTVRSILVFCISLGGASIVGIIENISCTV